jgi:hypothetical protein
MFRTFVHLCRLGWVATAVSLGPIARIGSESVPVGPPARQYQWDEDDLLARFDAVSWSRFCLRRDRVKL